MEYWTALFGRKNNKLKILGNHIYRYIENVQTQDKIHSSLCQIHGPFTI